ncbi:MAG: bifunctional folylpolyglutamate synthase/dihydrofolate synthase, partial [Hymenobacteraceae bacterium]|nr:bifunctional folylpolyglutamate synthase/dihydrofolate synthase [Hymenobacteraceae bacterium]MDX5397121.1 bifunctional folylpolyglutamate synthase/dihydrofolate synthase [Hymenobacteraceae bacterium]MDX5513199.1 bifunctional folylpolyglutamate synthase/dihydrofolate synthase [Hymenobacteraceae bacterium]
RVSATAFHQFVNIFKNNEPFLLDLELDLAGAYQVFNLPGVLKVLDCLQREGLSFDEEKTRAGLRQVKLMTGLKGRWQQLHEHPLIICDTGHNISGIQVILAQLETLPHKHVHFVFGAVNDKDISDILNLLPKHYTYYFCQAAIPRALPVEELVLKSKEAGLKGKAYPTVAKAIKAAKANAAPDDVIFIGGSTFVVAEIEDL